MFMAPCGDTRNPAIPELDFTTGPILFLIGHMKRRHNPWKAPMSFGPFAHAEFKVDAERLLRVCYDAPDDDFKFTAGALWKRKEGQWRCILTAPIIKWMKGMEPGAAKLELARRGCSWEWVPLSEGPAAGVDFTDQGNPGRATNCLARNTNLETMKG